MISAAVFGAIAGCLAGLFPGIHTNLLAAIISLIFEDVWFASIFLISFACARSVSDALPTVFLGASTDVMSLLPAHKMLLEGNGPEAVKFLVGGSLVGCIASILLFPLLLLALPIAFIFVRPFLFWILLVVVLILLLRDSIFAWPVFALAGVLGVLSLDSAIDPLFPMLSGLFGASGLILSLFDDEDIPLQFDTDILELSFPKWLKSISTAMLAGTIMMLFSGLGPQQAAALLQPKKINPKKYLVVTGALGTVDVIVSLAAFIAISKSRNGAIVAVERLLGALSSQAILVLIASSLFAAGIATIFVILVTPLYSDFLDFVGFKKISISVLLFLTILTIFLSGPIGLLIFVTATSIGLLPQLLGCSRSHAMGCLLVPTLLMLF